MNRQQIGYMMIIYIAGIQNIPGELIEAAKIDGATNRQLLRHVTIPMVMPSITICTFLTLTNSFKLFDQNLALTAGEPSNSSQMLALNIYETFYTRTGWEGAGQAKAVVFFIIVAVIAMLQNRLTRSNACSNNGKEQKSRQSGERGKTCQTRMDFGHFSQSLRYCGCARDFLVAMNSLKKKGFITRYPFALPDHRSFFGIENFIKGVQKTNFFAGDGEPVGHHGRFCGGNHSLYLHVCS